MSAARQIIAIGGGGFSRLTPDLDMCRYVLAQAGRRHPRICFIPTASGDNADAIANSYKMAKRLGARPSHLSLFAQPVEPLSAFVMRNDVIYVGGGNTRNMLILWRAWGLDEILRTAYRRGIVLSGTSAGGLCWFTGGVTDSFPGRYAELRCLGWLRGSFCPHFDAEPKRRPVYARLVRSGRLPAGYAADDCVGLHFVDGRLQRIVASTKKAYAYRVHRQRNRCQLTKVAPQLI